VGEEGKVEVERDYVINLSRVKVRSRTRRAPYAIRLIRLFAARHMRVDAEKVRVGDDVNREVWSRGIEKPPRRVSVRITKYSSGIVRVRLASSSKSNEA
jgi:large subunit ribosomal protein L31e